MANMAHEEIWDDSALIDSWDQALAEYKKYHSIHAQGGMVQVPSESSETQRNAKPETSGHDQPQPDVADETVAFEQAATEQKDQPNTGTIPAGGGQAFVAGPPVSHSASGLASGFEPQTVLGSIEDDGLKKLLMSWYYAGYYTGLYEGQQNSQTGRQNDEARP